MWCCLLAALGKSTMACLTCTLKKFASLEGFFFEKVEWKTDMQHSETVTISITTFGAIKFLCNNIIFSENLSLLLLSDDENFTHSTSSRTRQQLSSAEIDNRNSRRQTLTSIVVLSHKRAIYKSCRWHFQEFPWVFFLLTILECQLVSINI